MVLFHYRFDWKRSNKQRVIYQTIEFVLSSGDINGAYRLIDNTGLLFRGILLFQVTEAYLEIANLSTLKCIVMTWTCVT